MFSEKLQLTFVLFPPNSAVVAYEVAMEVDSPLPPIAFRGCAGAKFDWMNVRRGL